jgi:D-alanyl-D-alanine carboxypeptidase (penicillin-binding protein 5/6)
MLTLFGCSEIVPGETARRCLSLAPITSLFLAVLTAVECAHAVVLPPAKAPNIDATSYLLIDHMSEKVLAERNADERVEPASITKIMTTYAVGKALRSGLISLDDEVVVSEKAWKMEGSRMFIEVGKRVAVDTLLDGVIVQSGNDASVALAEHVSGSEEAFADVMNQHARQLGMSNSNFANATGLPDPMTYVTARDIARLASAMIREFPDLYQRFSKKDFVYNEIRQPNRNRLLNRDASVDGIKTGHTQSAGYCLVSSAVRDEMRLIAAVMGSDSDRSRTESSHSLLNFGFRFYETKQLYAADEVIMNAKVWRGNTHAVEVVPSEDVHITIPRGSYSKVKAIAHLDEPITAPLKAGDAVGRIVLTLNDDNLMTIALTARSSVDEGSIVSRLYDSVMMLFE